MTYRSSLLTKKELGDLSLLGQGSYGKAYKARWQNQEVYIKKYKVNDSAQLQSTIDAIAILKRIQGPHIIRFCGYFCDQPSGSSSASSSSSSSSVAENFPNLRVCHVTEFSQYGPLVGILRKFRKQQIPIPVFCVDYVAASVLKAVVWLHRRRVAHLNLTPWTVVICQMGIPKLSNFSSAISDDLWIRGIHGKLGYSTPPEACEQTTTYPAFAADVFSIAVLLFFMSVGRSPFVDIAEERKLDMTETETAIIERLQACDDIVEPYMKFLPPSHVAIIKAILQKEPADRPGKVDVEELYMFPNFNWSSNDPAPIMPSPLLGLL